MSAPLSSAERQRRRREWAASGGPARAAAIRRARAESGTAHGWPRWLDEKLQRWAIRAMPPTKAEQLRNRARHVLAREALATLARGRGALARQQRRACEAFAELTGVYPD